MSDFFLRQGVLPVFDDYVLESEIARGGMGVVYRARQISLDRPVAIKMILAGQLASPELIQRFRVEAQSASRLRHPGIIQIYEIGEWETQHYFSMELVDGASLAHCMGDIQLKERARARERRRQEKIIARLIAQVAQALDYAHKRGVLHRDVKPSNILIDERGNPRLTDFGLAKLIGHGAASNTKVFGTPSYAAPEQATAAEDELTTAADVYALGATLYHLLTGRPPHAADSVLAPLRCAGEQPPVSPRRWNPRLHRDLKSIAMRCLAIKPQDRYHSAEAVAEDLERFIQGKAITARSIGPTEWAIKWCRRNSALAASLMVLAAAVVVGVGVAVWQWRQVRTANVRLTTTVADLQWNSINEMVRHGHASTALAKVASIIRQNPREPGPAMFAMSLLEQRRIPLKAAPQIRHPKGAALSVARMSPDGRRIATASFDGTLRIWDALSSVQLVPPLQHQSAVNWIEFSPDGRAIASCAQDKAVRFWDAQTGSLLAAIKLPVHAAQRVQYSPDGKHLLAETDDSVFLFDAATRQLSTNPIVQQGRMIAAKFLDDQRLCVVSSDEHRAVIGVWELLAGTLQSSMQVEPLRRADLNLAADRVVCVGNDGRAFVEDFPTGLHRREIAKDQIVQRVLFDASGTRIAALGLGQWARVFSSDNGQALTDELPHYYVLNGAAFIDDGQKLLTWGSDSLAQLWDVEQNRMDCEPMRHADRVIYAEAARVGGRQFFLTTQTHSRAHSITEQSVDAGSGAAQLWSVDDRHNPQDRLFNQLYPGFDATRLSPDGRWVAFGTTENASGLEEIRLLNVSDGTAVCPHMVVEGGAWGLMFSPDGSRLVSTTSIGQVTVWGLPRGVAVSSPVMLPSGIHPAEMSADGSRFATGSNDGSVRIWETASAKPVLLMQHGAALHSLAFSPDGTLLASAGADHITRLWNTRTGAQVRALVGHTNEVMTVFFSPDGNKLVTGSFDFTARVWDTATGRTLAVLPHQGEVLDVAFSPDSKRIATGSRDCTAVIWDASSGQALVRTAPFDAAVRNVRFSPDGTRLITLDFHGVQVWDCASGHPLTVHMAHEMDGGTGFQDSALRFDLSSDGQTILLGADSPTEQLWHLPHPPAPTPLWFADLLESAAGERLTQTADVHQTATFNRPLEFPGELINPHSTDYYTAWARQWLCAQASPAASPVTSPGTE